LGPGGLLAPAAPHSPPPPPPPRARLPLAPHACTHADAQQSMADLDKVARCPDEVTSGAWTKLSFGW
jgi:hypothetical protein